MKGLIRNCMILLVALLATATAKANRLTVTVTGFVTSAADGSELIGVNVVEKGTTNGVVTDLDGEYSITVSGPEAVLVFNFIGYAPQEVKVGRRTLISVMLEEDVQVLQEVVTTGQGRQRLKMRANRRKLEAEMSVADGAMYAAPNPGMGAPANTYYDEDVTKPLVTPGHEDYAVIGENPFKDPMAAPFSTFSIDVDAASYSNMRRYVSMGNQPPKDAVRIEEMVNYFSYDYDEPTGDHPFTVNMEVGECPWAPEHKLVHIGLQGKRFETDEVPPSNLVFLIDVSGSMDYTNKLPLLKKAFRLLVNNLREDDRVSIVVYAGAAGVVLEPTSGADKRTILGALDKLQAGGSTAGGAGIRLAYSLAQQHYMEEGNNRVIIATDGDFNVGASSDHDMERLIESYRDKNIFLTALGFGMGNYKDAKMETLADKGNGNYAYIDNLNEARKVFGQELTGTLFTIAKDVKLQVDFNPAKVQAYRLIGYENRLLNDEDFHDDTKDAGELGAGHTVTALYEIVPVGVESSALAPKVDESRYQNTTRTNTPRPTNNNPELLTVKLRYKAPKGTKSKYMEVALKDGKRSWEKTSDNFRWSAAVASFGMLLRDSDHKGTTNSQLVLQLAKGAMGEDPYGHRREFIDLVRNFGDVIAMDR